MRAIFAALVLACAAGALATQQAAAGDSASPAGQSEFDNPSPIDFSRPFLVDGVRPALPKPEDIELPVEVIGREALSRPANPGIDTLIQRLDEEPGPSATVLFRGAEKLEKEPRHEDRSADVEGRARRAP